MEPYINKEEHIIRTIGYCPKLFYIFKFIEYSRKYRIEEEKFIKYWREQWTEHCYRKYIEDSRTFYKCGKIKEVIDKL